MKSFFLGWAFSQNRKGGDAVFLSTFGRGGMGKSGAGKKEKKRKEKRREEKRKEEKREEKRRREKKSEERKGKGKGKGKGKEGKVPFSLSKISGTTSSNNPELCKKVIFLSVAHSKGEIFPFPSAEDGSNLS